MKKKCLLIIAMLLTFVLSFAFVACGETTTPTDPTKPDTEQSQTGGEEGGQTGDKTTPHTHEFTTYSLVEGQEPTETAAGKATSTCSCGETTTVDVAQLTDTTVWTLTTTPATCTENGVKSYSSVYGTVTVAIPAAHTLGELQTETDSTCAVHGHVAYYQCSACEKYFSDADAANELTTVEKPLLAHTLGELQAETDSTCIAHGHVAYYQCSVCEKYFSDADAANELATIEKAFAEHTYSAWTADAETGKHVRTCQVEGCTASESEDHDYEGQTYTRNYGEGTHYIACKDCGYKNTSAHTFGDWVNYSSTEHKRSCTANGCYETEYGDHTGGTATCTDKAVCTACGTAYGNLTSHTFGSDGKCTNSKCTVTTSVVNKSYYRVQLNCYSTSVSTFSDAFTFGANGIATSSPFTSSSASNVSVYVKDIDKATGKVAVVAEYDDKSSSGGWGDDDYYSYGSSSSSSTTRKTETYSGYIDANGYILVGYSNGMLNTSYLLIPTDIAGDIKPTTTQFDCSSLSTSGTMYYIYYVTYTNGDNHFSVFIDGRSGIYAIYMNATVTDFAGKAVAPSSIRTAPAMVVKDGSGNLIAKYGYNGTEVIELDAWAGKYTNVDDETTTMTVSGTGNITMAISGNTYTGVYEAVSDKDDYNIIVKIKNSDNEVLAYYEVKADNTAYTFEYEIPNITLTYDLGDYGTNTTDTINKNTTYALKAAPEASDKTKIFSGWTIGDTTYKAGDKVVLSADTTITAVWDTKTKINVVDEKNVNREIYAGSEDTLSIVLGTPTCDGEEFKCWTIDGNAIDDEATVGTTEFTVTAVWKNKYTLTVVYGNGLENATLNYFEGDVPAPVEPKYTNGKVFDHWYTSADNGTTETAEYTPVALSGDTTSITIYTRWVTAATPFTGTSYGVFASLSSSSNATSCYVYAGSYYYTIDADGKITDCDSYTNKNKTITFNSADNTFTIGSGSSASTGKYFPDYSAFAVYSWSSSGTRSSVYIYFVGATATAQTDVSKNCYSYQSGKYAVLQVKVTRDGETKPVTIFIDGDDFYFDVVVEQETSEGSGTYAELTKFNDVGYYKGLKIYNSDKSTLIATFGRPSGKYTLYKALGTAGEYTATVDGVASTDKVTLDDYGVSITLGSKTGTYTYNSNTCKYDVYLDSNKEYYSMTIDFNAKTAELVKEMVTLSFNLNTVKDVDMGTLASVSVNKNISHALSSYAPTKEGYVFKGWYKTFDATEYTLSDSASSVTPTEDTTLYAKWAKSCTVSFETAYDTTPSSLTKEQDTWIYSSDRPTLTDTDDYVFYGWYVKTDSEKTPLSGSYKVTDDVTFVAIWKAKTTLTVKYMDGENEVITAKSVKVAVDKSISLSTYNPTSEECGEYVFRYFYKSGDTAQAEITSIEIAEGETATVIAKMEHKVTLTVMSNMDGLDNKSVTVYQNDEIDFTKVDFGYYKTDSMNKGKIVSGYYTDSDCTEGKEFTATSITEDTTIYAKWVEAGTYTIASGSTYGFTYNAEKTAWISNNNGQGSTDATLTITAVDAPIIVTFSYACGGEKSTYKAYDYLTIKQGSTTLVDKYAQGSDVTEAKLTTVGPITIQLNAGESLVFTYTKDSSGDKSYDYANIIGLTINGTLVTAIA